MIVQPGEDLAGYRIERIVGVGGMGIVYQATQLSLERTVALKVLSGELAEDVQFRERFRREARLAAQLDHPNIVPVFEAGEAGGVLYIAMRFVDGTTLSQRLAGGMSPRQAIDVLRPIASALDTAHDAGLVHRDVKPANILISAAGHPYLADFGIAKGSALTGLTRTRGFVGSTHYAAPEQIEGLEATRATDVYALAGLLFHCLTGRPPYERDTESSLLKAHLEDPAPSFREQGYDVPVALDDALATGLAKRPGDRFATGGELIDAVERALGALPEGAIDERLPSRVRDATDGAPVAAGSVAHATATDSDPSRILVPATAGLTVADPLRPHAATPAPAAGRRFWDRPHARRIVGAALALGASVAAIAGFLAIGPGSDERTLEAGPLKLAYGAPWRPAKTRIAGLRLEDGATLRATGAVLAAGTVAEPGTGAAPTPAALRRRWRDAPQPRLVRLGDGVEAYAFRARLKPHGAQVAYLIPTKRGYAAIACETPRRAATEALASCEDVAATARLTSGVTIAAGPDPELAARLDRTLRRLAVARRRHLSALSRGSAKLRARAADALANAHRTAARELRHDPAAPWDRQRVARVTAGTVAVARSLERLAAAGLRGDRRGYERARRGSSRADRRLRAAVGGLRGGGYRLD
jgi:hypothetical protein